MKRIISLLALCGLCFAQQGQRITLPIGASGQPAEAVAAGADTDVTIRVIPKGSGVIELTDSGELEVLITANTGSAVNEVTVTNAATGNAPSLSATGGDTDIGIDLAGKGTGAVSLGQATSAGVDLVADQPIRDSSGNELLKFSKATTAVNEVTVGNAATGTSPVLSATGGDSNINLELERKGSGKLVIDKEYQLGDRTVKIFHLATNASLVDQPFFIADRPYKVEAIYEIHKTLASSGPTSLAVKKAADGTAIASGTTLMTGTFDLTGTNDTLQTATLTGTAADLLLAENDRLGVDITGTTTALAGVDVAVVLSPGRASETVSFYLEATGDIIDAEAFFTASRPSIITGAKWSHAVAGDDGGGLKAQIVKDTGTDAPGAGTDILTNESNAGFDAQAAADTIIEGTLTGTAATLRMDPGDRLSLDFAGATATLAGVCLTVEFEPLYDRKEVVYELAANGNLVDETFFIADRAYEVILATEVHATAGNDGSDVSAQLTIDKATDVPGGGTDLVSLDSNKGFLLKGTANTVQIATWKDTRFNIMLAGDRLSVDYAGNLATLAGVVISVSLRPI
jgi:hypothetical protein